LGAPVTCGLQGEDAFLEALPEPHRSQCWQTIAERAADVDVFLAPSRYFGDLMGKRMSLPAGRVQVLPNGINLEGYEPNGNQPAAGESRPPVLGYFARMCKEKGLDTLVAAYIEVRRRNRVKNLKLRVGGSCGPSDEPFVKALTGDLEKAGLAGEVEFHRNVSRAKKQELLASFSVFSVPAGYGEAFGLYVIEALAAGAPVVQPRTGAFPELVESTGGGVLCAADDSKALADALEGLLLEPARLAALGAAGRRAVLEKFSAEAMARATLEVFGNLRSSNAVVAGPRS
jgi:glycosyltransferase involved in cell wall biosynthesis